MASKTSERKEKKWRDVDVGPRPPWVYQALVPQAPSSWVLGLSCEVYIFSVLALVLSGIDQRQEATSFLFPLSFEYSRKKIGKATCWIFQICKDCYHENIVTPKLNVLYQISLSQNLKNIFFFIIMYCNHEKMFVWNASIWVGGPWTSGTILYII